MLSVTNLSQKESFPGSEFKPASIWTCWMQSDRQMQSAPFMPELHRWISKLTARHLQRLSTRRSFDHHGKGNGNFCKKKSFEKRKKVVSLIDLKEMKTRNDCEIACDCVERANVVLHVGLCKEIFARKHTATHKPTSAQPPHSDLDDTHTHIHTHTHLQDGWSPWSPQASYDRRRHRNCFPTQKSASISEKVNISWGHRSVDALFTCVDLHVL